MSEKREKKNSKAHTIYMALYNHYAESVFSEYSPPPNPLSFEIYIDLILHPFHSFFFLFYHLAHKFKNSVRKLLLRDILFSCEDTNDLSIGAKERPFRWCCGIGFINRKGDWQKIMFHQPFNIKEVKKYRTLQFNIEIHLFNENYFQNCNISCSLHS